mgnify:CR=1 FL=1
MWVKPNFSEVPDYIEVLKSQKCSYKSAAASDPPAVSIISSFYNVPRDYFLETNHSIENQTFQNYEWIIADDCSTDADAIALFDELPTLNPKIRTTRRLKNGGLSAGRNTAIAQAKGKYLFFMDTDDLLAPTAIEKCVLFLEAHLDFSFVNTYSVGFQAEEYWWTKGFNQPSEFIKENRVTGRLLYRKQDFDQVGGFDETLRFYEDWDRWLKAIVQGQKGWTIPEFLDCYRRTQTGLLAASRAKVDQERQVSNEIRSRYQSFFEDRHLPDLELDRPMFSLRTLRRQPTVQNPLNADNAGKRILCWFPHLEVGGADKFNLDLLTGLKHRGYDITIVTTMESQHPWFAEFYAVTPDIFHLPRLFHYGHWLSFARYILASRQIDLCFISNAYYAYPLLPFLRREFPQLAFVDYTHTEDPGWREGGYPRISCQYSAYLEAQVTTSNYLAEQFRQLNLGVVDRLKVCYVNVSEQHWQPDKRRRKEYRAKLSIADDTTVFVFPARMTAQKRPLFFLDIINKLLAEGASLKVLMLGQGDLLEPVKAKIARLELSEVVHILPFVSPQEMVGYYSAADLVLLPSAYEGISLVMYEAMSMGLPVVASDVGGQDELLSTDSGILVPLGPADESECDAYVSVLQPLIGDSQLRQRMGSAARFRIRTHFRLEMMVKRMAKIFQDAIAARQQQQTEIVMSELMPCEESLLWIQEFLALEKVWHDFQNVTQTLSQLQSWVAQLEKERNLYKTESAAWQRVAQKNQIALNQLKSKTV